MGKFLFLFAIFVLALSGCGGSTVNDGVNLNVLPSTGSLLPLGTMQFTTQENVYVDWSAPDGGTVVNGLFTAPAQPGVYRVVATNIVNPLASGVANVTVANVQATVTPSSITVIEGSVNTNAFTATLAGTSDKAVTWTVDQSNGGTIVAGTADGSGNARGSYTAGSSPGLFTIRATTHADSTVSSVAQVRVLGINSLGLSPVAVSLTTTPPFNSVVFTAVLTDASGHVDSTTPLTWDIPNNPAGANLTGAGLRARTFTVPTNFVGTAVCQLRVRTSTGVAMYATVQVASN